MRWSLIPSQPLTIKLIRFPSLPLLALFPYHSYSRPRFAPPIAARGTCGRAGGRTDGRTDGRAMTDHDLFVTDRPVRCVVVARSVDRFDCRGGREGNGKKPPIYDRQGGRPQRFAASASETSCCPSTPPARAPLPPRPLHRRHCFDLRWTTLPDPARKPLLAPSDRSVTSAVGRGGEMPIDYCARLLPAALAQVMNR